MNETTFKWSNYLRPTPINLQYLALGIKSILVTIGGAAFFSGNEKVGFYVLLGGAVLDELAKFFHKVADESMKTVSVTFPEKIADQVEIKQEVKKGE